MVRKHTEDPRRRPRRARVRKTLFVLTAATLAACGSKTPGSSPDAGIPDGGTADAFIGPSTGILNVSNPDPSDFYGIPFPNDLHLAADGTVDLTNVPRPTPTLQQYFDLFQTVKGFGTNSAVVMRFTAPIDVSSLPATPEDSLLDGASVYLVDVSAASPDYGKKWPVKMRFEHFKQMTIGTDWLSVLPYPGFPLDPLTTYAVVVTTRAKATDGTPIGRPADLDAIFGAPSTDPKIMKAQAVYQPLLDWLDEAGGDERADVALATVYTTQDPTSLIAKAREVLFAMDPPVPDAPLTHDMNRDTTDYELWEGRYMAPNFQSGTPPYMDTGGQISTDSSGNPIVQWTEDLRFAITVPKAGAPQLWPICLYSHGTGGDYMSFVNEGIAARLAQQGIATISIDNNINGERANGGDPDIDFFNVFNPVAARDNVRQGAIDNFSLERLAWGLNINGNTFDMKDEMFFGHSQGGLVGPGFVAYEPQVKGAIMSGAGALIYIALLEKTAPVDVTALVGEIDRDYPLDEFDPILAMVQMFMEPADPANYGPLIVRDPPAGRLPTNIFQTEGFIDHYAPDDGIVAFGVSMGLQPVAPLVDSAIPEGFTLRGQTLGTTPVSGNLNGVTGVFLQYTMAAGSDGHFVVFDVMSAVDQSDAFLKSLAPPSADVATLVAP